MMMTTMKTMKNATTRMAIPESLSKMTGTVITSLTRQNPAIRPAVAVCKFAVVEELRPNQTYR